MFYNRSIPRNYNNYQRITYPTHCRYCGKNVFYHENEHGSRVFFEELGVPWTKHHCHEYLNRHSKNR